MNMMNVRKSAGFTLIELVMVIVILGILAAFALPRFADLGGDAERASVSGARGAVQSASAIVRSAVLAGQAQTDDSGTDPVTTLELEGVSLTIVSGYVAASSIRDAAQLSSEFNVSVENNIATISQGGCSFQYIEPGAGTEDDSGNTAPIITQVAGC